MKKTSLIAAACLAFGLMITPAIADDLSTDEMNPCASDSTDSQSSNPCSQDSTDQGMGMNPCNPCDSTDSQDNTPDQSETY